MILLTGATGTVGSTLVGELAGTGHEVRALVRSPQAARDLAERGVEPVLGSFEDADALLRAARGAERLFLLSPPGDDEMVAAQSAVVDAAAAAGVRHVVKLSSIGADEPTQARIIRAHREIERRIEASGMAWTHLRPHWFMQNELGQAASIAADGVFHAPDVGRISLIDARDVAAVAARVLTAEGHEGRAYVLTGPRAVSYAEVAEAYGTVLGNEVRWVPVSLEQAHASMLDGGLPPGLAAGFTEILARYRQGGATARVSLDTEALLGRSPRDVERFVADHREQLMTPAAVA